LLQYSTLQFSKFEEIQAVGYRTATKLLEEWQAAGKLPTGFEEGFEGQDEKKRKGRSLRRNSI
jgi:lysophospholipid hydrolase